MRGDSPKEGEKTAAHFQHATCRSCLNNLKRHVEKQTRGCHGFWSVVWGKQARTWSDPESRSPIKVSVLEVLGSVVKASTVLCLSMEPWQAPRVAVLGQCQETKQRLDEEHCRPLFCK